jgi:hypothetical protein
MIDCKPDTLGVIGYSPSTGKFFCLKGKRRGQELGSVGDGGYVRLSYRGKQVAAHHLAWRIMTGRWPEQEIDHINRVRHDNRFENLRLATRSENSQNGPKKSTNTSGFKGVHWHKRSRAWVARIMVERDEIHLGSFRTREEAYAAYVAAAKEFHGEFHCLD